MNIVFAAHDNSQLTTGNWQLNLISPMRLTGDQDCGRGQPLGAIAQQVQNCGNQPVAEIDAHGERNRNRQ